MGAGRTPLLIFPCNGNGLEALDCLGEQYEFAAFVDDTVEKQRTGAYGQRVLSRDALLSMPEAVVLAVPGSPTSYTGRRKVIEGLNIDERRFARVIHPTARVSPLARIGHNVLIMAGVVITSNAVVGSHVCILPNTVIHHDVTIGAWTLIGSNVTVAGHVNVGENCYIGSGTRIMNGLSVGSRTLIGIGSNVIRALPDGVKAVGNPARILN